MIALFKQSENRLKRIWFIVFGVCLFLQGLDAQQKNPVSVNVNMTSPYSIFLSDYISIGSSKLTATLLFNDYNEASRDVYLKIKVESNNFRIVSRADFIPSKPITLTPGVPVQLNGDDLSAYFDLNNVDLSGMSKADLSTSGRLIEGNYTFCFDVYDYKKHTLISNEACAMANIRLNDPPVQVLPADISIVPLNSPNINFQWQLPMGDQSVTKYILSLYELPDYQVGAAVAVQNNQALKIFESSQLDNPYFIYDISSPLLKRGSKYAWRVQAININGRDEFKNKGFSLVRGFSYGYPENGKININAPLQGHAFSLRESKTFRWYAPDNLTPNQPYFYQTRIVKVQADQTDSDAISHNLPIYTNQSASLSPQDPDYELTVPAYLFGSQQKFAWQITAHTNDQKIASSPVTNCFGPPLIEAFYAGNNTVFVTNTTSSDISDLSGDGEVKVSYSGKIQKVHFDHIKIEHIGALLIMTKGFVKAKYTGDNITLTAEYEKNGKATYEVDSIMIDTQYMKLKGIVNWVFPHLTIKPENPSVKSVAKWIVFEDFVLIGTTSIHNTQQYDLADPYGFSLRLDTTSYFILRGNNNYSPFLNGSITLPKNVKNSSKEKVNLPFSGVDRLDYIGQKGVQQNGAIELISGTDINLYATSYFIDLSESISAGKLAGQPEWKGVYITGSSINFPLTPDNSNQLFFKTPLSYSLHDTLQTSDTCWVTSSGLQLSINKIAENPDSLWFNTFPGVFGNYILTIQNSVLTKGCIKGKITVPLLSETNRFPFTVPLTERGFATGYLDQKLDGSAIVFNSNGGEQKINLTINRAVFSNKERLDMNIDLAWPLMDINMKSLEGLEIWGNGNIGFMVANGTTPLSSQIQSKIKGFEVNIDYIGCGRQGNIYAFGTSAKIVMAEDISGPDGAPVVNIFSMAENSLFTGGSGFVAMPDMFQNILGKNGGTSTAGSNNTVGVKQNNAPSDTTNTDQLVSNLSQNLNLPGKLQKDSTQNINTTIILPHDTTSTGITLSGKEIKLSDIIALIDKVYPFLNDEQKTRVATFKEQIATYEQSELVLIYNEIKDYDKFLKEIAKQALRTVVAKIEKPIKDEAKKVKTSFAKFVNKNRDVFLKQFDGMISSFVDSLTEVGIRTFVPKNEDGDTDETITNIIYSLSDDVQKGLIQGINNSVTASVKKNITNQFNALIDTTIILKIDKFVENAILGTGFAIIDNGTKADLKLGDLGSQAEKLLPSIGEDLLKSLSVDNIAKTARNLVVDSYNGIRWDSVSLYILKQVAIDIAESVIGKKIEKALVDAAQNVLGETGGEVAGALMKNVHLDFSNLGEKLRKGELDKIVKFDPSYIVVPTPVAKFEGWVKFTNDDPVWGDSWQATLSAKFNVGVKFTASAKYVNGSIDVKKKDDSGTELATTETISTKTSKYTNSFKYWFLEVGVVGLNALLTPTPITFDGATGKVFHHMSKVSKGVYMPADSVRFGASLQLFLFDTPTQGSILAFDVGAEITILDNGFIFDMIGDAGIGNSAKIKGQKISYTLVSATGYLGYNSIENHIVGNFSVTFNTAPILCAGGELDIDIKKDSWFVNIGTKEKPIFYDLFCTKHPIFQGWLDIGSNGLDMGLMVKLAIRAESPWIGFTGFKVKPWAEFDLDFGATVVVDFKPFAIEEAHVWLELYAGIGIKYDTWLGGGDFTIASIDIGGDVLFQTVPKTYFSGKMHGKVTVFDIGVGFDLSVEHEFS